jgi:hypothetical protein
LRCANESFGGSLVGVGGDAVTVIWYSAKLVEAVASGGPWAAQTL